MTELELIKIFAGNLEDKMREVGITQAELAFEAGLAPSAVSRYLSGKRLPTIRALVNMCDVLECDMQELVPIYDHIE